MCLPPNLLESTLDFFHSITLRYLRYSGSWCMYIFPLELFLQGFPSSIPRVSKVVNSDRCYREGTITCDLTF